MKIVAIISLIVSALATGMSVVLFSKLAAYKLEYNEILKTETSEYHIYSETIRNAEKIREGATRADVEAIMTVPPDNFFPDPENQRITWYWSAHKHAGSLHHNLKLVGKGHYDVAVIFNNAGLVEKVYFGIN